MSLTRYTDRPMDLFTQMRREMDDLMHNWFGRLPTTTLATWPGNQGLYMPCELEETENEFVVRMDAPGVADKDLKISLQGEVLTIRGERREQKSETKGNVYYTERNYGVFSRAVTLPMPVKAEEIKARARDGVLEIHLPKAQRNPAREIKIERTP